EDAGQTGQTGLGRTVVCLAEVAEQAGRGAGVDDSAVTLFAHQAKGWLADEKSALEVDVDHGVDHGVVHLVKGLVAQDAGVIDQHVDPSEGGQRGLHDCLSAFGSGDGVVVRRGLPAQLGDLVYDPLSGGRRGAAAVECATKVVDQDMCSSPSKLERVRAPET